MGFSPRVLAIAAAAWLLAMGAAWLVWGWQLPLVSPIPPVSPEFPGAQLLVLLAGVAGGALVTASGGTLLRAWPGHAALAPWERLAMGFLLGGALLGGLGAWFGFVLLLPPLFWVLLAGVALGGQGWRAYSAPALRGPAEGWAAAVLLGLVALAALAPAVESDGLRYHLTAPQEWLRASHFVPLPYNANSNIPAQLGMEAAALFGAWELGRAYQLWNALHAAALAAVAGGLLRRVAGALALAGIRNPESGVRGEETGAATGALLVVAVPVVAIVGAWPFADVGSAAYLFAAVLVLGEMSYEGRRSVAGCALGSVLLGAAVAAKISALPLAGLVGLWALAVVWFGRGGVGDEGALHGRDAHATGDARGDEADAAGVAFEDGEGRAAEQHGRDAHATNHSAATGDADRAGADAAGVAFEDGEGRAAEQHGQDAHATNQRFILHPSSFILFLGALLLLPWLLKNLLYHGNPLYPLAWGLLGGPEWNEYNDLFYKERLATKGLGRDLAALLLSPWNATMRYTAFESHTPGPLLLGLLPLAAGGLGWWAARRRGGWSAGPVLPLGLLLVAGWVVWFFTYQSVRFLIPQIVAAVVLGGGAAVALMQAATDRRVACALRGALLAVVALGAVWTPYYRLVASPDYAAALGLYDNDRRRALAFNAYPVVQWLNEETASGEPVFYIGEHRAFYARTFRPLASDWFDTPLILAEIRATEDNEALLAAWRERGISKVLVNWTELSQYLPIFRERFTPQEWQRFAALMDRLDDRVLFGEVGGIFVAAVPESEE